MVGKLRVSCAVLVLSGTLACAVTGTARKSASPAPPDLVKEPTTGMELVYVRGGCFRMGNTFDRGGPEEQPAHEVCVDDFYIGKFEVTQGQWRKVMGSNPSANSACGDDCPVENVSWNDAQLFVSRMNGLSGREPPGTYGLPTEAEWEYAARSGGKNEKYSGANEHDMGDLGWFEANSNGQTQPVGQRGPNGLGLRDMTGNVWEWTNDWFGATYYSSSPRDNPTGPSTGERRVLRGGSFTDEGFEIRASYRNYLPPDSRHGSTGFRLLRAASPQARPRAQSAPSAPRPLGDAASGARPPPFKDHVTGMELVFVKGGCYRMGDVFGDGRDFASTGVSDEEPVHEVCVGDFLIGKFEATQGQWRAVMGDVRPGKGGGDLCAGDDCPMGNVSRSEVQEFISRLNGKDGGSRYRLPTEAEWEYAARSGGRSERYSGGNDVQSVSWLGSNSGYSTTTRPYAHPVGSKAPNGLGIHDMSGNVWEMTADWYSPTYYSVSPRDNPTGPPTGEARVKRGGCATGRSANSRVSRRSGSDGSAADLDGFRLVRTP
jgi:formylglycine-generating enzyme required for sulfatase activity